MGFLLLLFTVVPVLELYLLIEVGQFIGALETILIVLVTGFIGAYMAKTQGLSIWLNTQQQLAKGLLPADNLIHGFLVFVGGVLLITPGFMTDILGFSLVFPTTRKIYIGRVKAYLKSKVKSGQFNVYSNVNGDWQPVNNPRDVTSKKNQINKENGPAKVIDMSSFRNPSN